MRTIERTVLLLFLTILLITAVNVKATADYFDPYHLFKFRVPFGWIFQVSESEADLLVFYGPSQDQLLYIEYFKEITDQSSLEFAARVIEHYGSVYGLIDFEIIRELDLKEIDGISVADVVYSYTGTKKRTERRIFAILQNYGLTITFGDAKDHYHEGEVQLNLILDNWTWVEVIDQ